MNVLLLIPHAAALAIYNLVYAYTSGVWFLIRHPKLFIQFVAEWRKFRDDIADADDVRNSGFHDMNRTQRRHIQKAARKIDKRAR